MHTMSSSSWPTNQHHHAHHDDERDWPEDMMAFDPVMPVNQE